MGVRPHLPAEHAPSLPGPAGEGAEMLLTWRIHQQRNLLEARAMHARPKEFLIGMNGKREGEREARVV